MSTSLYWSRVPHKPKEENLYNLKYALAKKLWYGDGSCAEPMKKVSHELVPFLEGIEAGSDTLEMREDARKLINAIESYGEVQLCIR